MVRSLRQLSRRLVPNVALRIRHVEEGCRLEVHCREHLGLLARGASAYEPRYVKTLRSLIGSGNTVFDVGANIGFYSVLFSRWVGPAGRVVAYEPDPVNINRLRRNTEINKCDNTIIRPVALAQDSGRKLFSQDRITRSTGHLGEGATLGETHFADGELVFTEVTTSTLDVEVENIGAPDVIKMDVEGGEFDTLVGGRSLLRLHRPLIVSELSSWTEDRPTDIEKPLQVTRMLSDLGYSLWDLDLSKRITPNCSAWTILAVPKERERAFNINELLTRTN